MFSARKLVGVELISVEVVAPSVAEVMPPPPLVPEIHKSVPLVLAALRGLPALIASVSAVVVSTVPEALTRAITRLIAADVVAAGEVVATGASYPASTRYWPSADRVRDRKSTRHNHS